MIRKVRSKVASSISKINEAEDFNFTSWLKKPPIHHHPIESIDSDFQDTSEIVVEIASGENFGREFNFTEPAVNDEFKNYSFPKVRSNAIFFMIPIPDEKFVFIPNSEIDNLNYTIRGVEFLLKKPIFKTVKVQFENLTYNEYECRLEPPETFNYLTEEVPEVYNIDLLEINNLVDATANIDIHEIKLDQFKKIKIGKKLLPELPALKKIYKIKIPSIGKYKTTQKEISLSEFFQPKVSDGYPFKLSKVKNYYAKFHLSKIDAFLLYSSSITKPTDEITEKSKGKAVYSVSSEQLKFILSNVRKIDWDKSKPIQIKLRKHEESAAKFLVESDYALLQEELGIDSEKEAIAALKILFGHKMIKSALIITSESKKGNPGISEHLNTLIGWNDKIISYCSEIPLTLIEGDDQERIELWGKSGLIALATLDTVINDYHFSILDHKRLEKFDCIVLDNAHLITSADEKGKKLITSLRPKTLWAISNILDKNLQEELNSLLVPSVTIGKTIVRDKESVVEDLPKFIYNDMWVEADEDQSKEFVIAMTECKKELKRVLESENPLRFMANIFTQLHRLNQLGNFAPNKSRSPKSELLLEHVSTIKANGKKVLILSQYDRQGIKKLSELLTNHGIKQITVQGGSSVDEINRSVSSFKSNKDMVAFIADSKSSKIKFSDLDVSYVIKFDQWWNPINNWELEDKFSVIGEEAGLKESVNIFSYYSLGTIDKRVRELLFKNDLLDRNVFELMQPKLFEELISVDEWLKIFNMPSSGEDKNHLAPEEVLKQLNLITIDKFRTTLVNFFSALGYTNLDVIGLPNSNSFNIVGKSQRNNRVFALIARVFIEAGIDKKALKESISESSSAGNDKIFIVTRGEFPDIKDLSYSENVTLLDGLALSRILLRLGLTNVQP